MNCKCIVHQLYSRYCIRSYLYISNMPKYIGMMLNNILNLNGYEFFQYCTKEFPKQDDFIYINILVKVVQRNSFIKQAYNEFTLIVKSVPFPHVLKHIKKILDMMEFRLK